MSARDARLTSDRAWVHFWRWLVREKPMSMVNAPNPQEDRLP